jgi:hypothetical protein
MLSNMRFLIWFIMYLSYQIIENVVFSCLMKLNILQIITSLVQVSKNANNWLPSVAKMVASGRWQIVGTANNPWTAPSQFSSLILTRTLHNLKQAFLIIKPLNLEPFSPLILIVENPNLRVKGPSYIKFITHSHYFLA